MKFQNHDLLARLEGNVLKPYRDVAGLLTIGVGHLLTPAELTSGLVQGVTWKDGITTSESLAILDHDVRGFANEVERLVTVPLTQAQFDALVIFAFNVGIGAFSKSTLLKKLNAGDYDAVPAQLRRWNKAGGKVVKGLINRREAEVKLWECQNESK